MGGNLLLFFLFLVMVTGFISAEESCTDSDGGIKDYWHKGYVSGIDVGKPFTFEDNCNGNTLNEYGCDEQYPDEPRIENFECPDICKEGACTSPAISAEEPEGVIEEVPIDLVAKGIFKFDPSKGINSLYDQGLVSLYDNIEDLAIIEGDYIKLVGLIENKGSEKTESFFTELYIDGKKVDFDGSKPGNNGFVPFLNAFGGEYDINNGFSWQATLGSHTIKYLVDTKNEINEENENNNEYQITINVGVREERFCSDPDGKNYYEEGMTKRLEKTQFDSCYKYPESSVNSCEGEGCKVQESFCGTDDKIYAEFYPCPYGCFDGACIGTEEIIEPEENEPIDMPENNEESKIDYFCSGCKLDELCYPLGYRKSGEFCSNTLEFVNQLEKEISCENNFECSSNVCVSGECISEGLIQKIINWFKRLFGS